MDHNLSVNMKQLHTIKSIDSNNSGLMNLTQLSHGKATRTFLHHGSTIGANVIVVGQRFEI